MKLQFILLSFVLVTVLATNEYEYKKLVFITNLHIGAAFTQDEEGLRTVIKNIIIGYRPMGQIAMMLAVPELADLTNIRQSMDNQIFLQEDILRVTSIPVPQVDPNRDFSGYLLSDIGEARRVVIKVATKPLMLAALNGVEPDFYDFAALCRLIGIYKDLKCSNSFIITARADSYGNCTLKNDENIKSYYRIIDNQMWEVEFTEFNVSTRLLIEEIGGW
ncbi:uncharacterized protein LOC126832993 isoform X1 [Adelges cooleyi]|uniref:uncharacterized protein LOC126832993 isoform X1 n=1 Tax=Adelges cooleyi TaxID=133065 RepID=UPI0021806078|nr:uncharacterized protein LOC126832993 isoform X1 [Adelges cooleyi]XP_050420042.1 uncharacterized protein LOC126832993 isoform X1 [Adelges cooleyi]